MNNRNWGINHKQSIGNRNIITTPEELEQILYYPNLRNYKHYLIFRLLIETGMRKGELIKLSGIYDLNLSPIKIKALIIKDGADFIHSIQKKYVLRYSKKR